MCGHLHHARRSARWLLPGLLAVVTPSADRLHPRARERSAGLLAGVTVTGVLMAIFMSNSGGAWDNAKKSFRRRWIQDHERRDCSIPRGPRHTRRPSWVTRWAIPSRIPLVPSLNILVKLISVVALGHRAVCWLGSPRCLATFINL